MSRQTAKRSYIRRMGLKGQEWAAVRKQLKAEFEACGITRCEIRLPGCMGKFAMSFAHAVKRSRLVAGAPHDSQDSLYCCVLSCGYCHAMIEKLPADRMREIVMLTIESRTEKE